MGKRDGLVNPLLNQSRITKRYLITSFRELKQIEGITPNLEEYLTF